MLWGSTKEGTFRCGAAVVVEHRLGCWDTKAKSGETPDSRMP